MQASVEALRKQEELLAVVEERRRIKDTVVPTDDKEVRRMLRALEEPITRFGEREVSNRTFTACFWNLNVRNLVFRFAWV